MKSSGRTPIPIITPGRWPWQRSLRNRIILSYGVILLVAMVMMGIFVGQLTYRAQLDAAEHDLELAAFLTANALEDPLSGFGEEFDRFEIWEKDEEDEEDEDEHDDDVEVIASSPASDSLNRQQDSIILPRLQQLARLAASDTAARVTILDVQGDALADSDYPISDIENQLQQVEVQAALMGREQHDVREEPLSGSRRLYAAAPIQQGEQLLGVVQMSRPMDEVMGAIWNVEIRFVAAGLFILIASVILGIWNSQRLVRPLQELEAAAIATAGGDFQTTVAVSRRDELGALAYAFNYMVAELRQMIEQQRAFVANASHELRTPITNIKLRSEALLSIAGAEPGVTERYLTEIDSEADRLARLATELLDLSRLVQSPERSHPEQPVDVQPIALSVVEMMQLRAQQKGVRLHTDLSDNLPPLSLYSEHLEAILVNLIDNAIKYTPAGGEVLVSAQMEEGVVTLSVQDSGPGIPEEDLPHIFDPFYRVDKARSRRRGEYGEMGSGTGLGLSIVKQLVEQNEGQIQVETGGAGSKFVVDFSMLTGID